MPGRTLRLEDFDISPTHGFLSPDPPIDRLPNIYEPWERIIEQLPELIEKRKIGDTVRSLPILDIDCLTTESHWKRGYVLLAFITHAYVWGQEEPIQTIPPALTEPFLRICRHVGMKPVLSYAGLCLWNWRSILAKIDSVNDLGDLQTIASFTGTTDEAAFYLVPVLVEKEGGHLAGTLIEAIDAARLKQWASVETALHSCEATVRRMMELLGLLYTNCDPSVFFNQLRKFLGGLEVFFRSADGTEIASKTVGGSAIQSVLFMSIDQLLGVQHRSLLFQEMLAYAPRKHREFYQSLQDTPTLSELLGDEGVPSGSKEALAACCKALQSWRSKHITVVSRYIVLPARQKAATADEKEAALMGTGGSPLVEFLKQSRDETDLAL